MRDNFAIVGVLHHQFRQNRRTSSYPKKIRVHQQNQCYLRSIFAILGVIHQQFTRLNHKVGQVCIQKILMKHTRSACTDSKVFLSAPEIKKPLHHLEVVAFSFNIEISLR